MKPLRKQRNPYLIMDPNILLSASISYDEMGKYERYTRMITSLIPLTKSLAQQKRDRHTKSLVFVYHVPTNNLLDLPNNNPNIYELIDILEDEDFNTIKDQLCKPGTEWNTKGKNPGTISRPSLQPEAKLWNTFVKRNLIPTSHNQTVDRTRLVLINAIITGYKFNVGEVIAKELSEACQNDKGILAFPCIIFALCQRAAVPTHPTNKYTSDKSAQPSAQAEQPESTPRAQAKSTTAEHQASNLVSSPSNSPHNTYAASPIDTPAATLEAQASFAATPASTSVAELQPAPVQTTEPAPSIQILQLRNQLQRMEARQLQFIAETKAANFFSTAQPKSTVPAASAADPTVAAGNTEPLELSYDAGEDIFDWHTPFEHQVQPRPTPRAADIRECSQAQKHKAPAHAEGKALSVEHPPPQIPTTNTNPARSRGKALAGRIITRDRTSSLDAEEQSPPRPAKRQRRYYVITTDSDDDSSTEVPTDNPE
ncbi:hypothetical protein V6N13_097526 [Hibiscus sabdariffa]